MTWRSNFLLWVAMALMGLRAFAGTSPEVLFNDLLKSVPENLPPEVESASVSAEQIREEEKNAGMVGKIAVEMHGLDSKAKVLYYIFSNPEVATEYYNNFFTGNSVLQNLEYPPGATCLKITSAYVACKLLLREPAGVMLVSFGSVLEIAAELMKTGYDHLNRVTGQSEQKPEMEPWQTSWAEFVKEVQRLYSKDADEEEFASIFNGKQISWEGKIAEATPQENGLEIVIEMPEATVNLSNGEVVPFDSLDSRVSKEFVVPEKKEVRFRVTLMKKSIQVEGFHLPESAVFLMNYSDENENTSKTVIKIFTEDDLVLE